MLKLKKITAVTLALIIALSVMVVGASTISADAAVGAASVSLKSTAYNSNATVTIGWQKGSGGATGFQIAKKKLGDKSYSYIYVGGGSTQSYTDKSVVCGTIYYYQVRTVYKVGKTANYSSWSNTKTITTLYRPTITSLNDMRTKLNVNWNKIKGVSHYRLAFKRLSDKAWNYRYVKSTYYNIFDTSFEDSYAVQVCPMNGSIAGQWSEVKYILIGTAYTKPVIESVSRDLLGNEDAGIIWSYWLTCEKYYLYVQKAGDGYWTQDIIDDTEGLYNYSYKRLQNGNTYYFQVRAQDKYGNWSPYSKVYTYHAKELEESEKRDLREMLILHKWRYSIYEESDYMKLSYDWLLEFKEDGTWTMDMENSVDDDSVSHTLGGTWRLDGTTLTVDIKDEEISEFNETELLIFAEDMTDEKLEKEGIESLVSDYPDDLSDEDWFLYVPQLKWYVSDKYFCFYTIVFKAE